MPAPTNPSAPSSMTANNAAAPGPPTDAESKRRAARETIDILHEISTLLNTQLDRQSLSYCVSLIENGVSPEALAKVIRDLRALNNNTNTNNDSAGSPTMTASASASVRR